MEPPASKRLKISSPLNTSWEKSLEKLVPDDLDNDDVLPPRVSLASTAFNSAHLEDGAGSAPAAVTVAATASDNHSKPQILEIEDESSVESGGSEGLDDFHCTQLDLEDDTLSKEDTNDDQHKQLATIGNAQLTPAAGMESVAVATENICFICGSSFSRIKTGLKGRLNHIKKCAKKFGVTAQDVRLNDDEEAFLDEPPSATDDDNLKKPAAKINPYDKQTNQRWHGSAARDLQLVDNTTAEASTSVAAVGSGATKQTALTNYFKAPLRDLNNFLVANARRLAKTAGMNASAKNKSGGKRRRWGAPAAVRACPQYKRIPHTDFVCDGFMYAKPTLTKNYFLTHFHSDHYGGIDSSWNKGIIYCSLITANLVRERLGVESEYLHPLGMNTPVIVESNGRPITVTLLDANHCPGAVLFLFEIGNRTVLHVGDFRWNREKMLPTIKAISQRPRLDELFLDTTYCDARHTLPDQDSTIKATVECAVREVQQAKRKKERLLLLFGAYTIGKERIYQSVAERLGMKIYVDSQRYKVLSLLESPDMMAMLTTKKVESNLWVVPLQHISMKNLPPYLHAQSRAKNPVRKYDRVVGFRPTGWSNRPGNSHITTATRGRLTTHSVPYSEHSSFPELLQCISTLKPKKITPTVNVSKSQEQVDLLLRSLKSRQQLLI